METSIALLGLLNAGDVIRLKVSGDTVDAVLILIEDQVLSDAGVIAGGGPANKFFEYSVQVSGRYFVSVQFDPASSENQQLAAITALPGNSTFQPPAKQTVVIAFQPNYLTDPGLVDPESFSNDEVQLLADISELIRGQIMTTLLSIFDGSPVEIVDERDRAG
ncbi:MAG: hypothetical protein ACYTF1_02195 [Planctomycetota bacterium]|jgi:hypothetical protein